MEQWPQDAIGKTVIIFGIIFRGQIQQGIRDLALFHEMRLCRGPLDRFAAPSQPYPSTSGQSVVESDRHPSGLRPTADSGSCDLIRNDDYSPYFEKPTL